ncbi:MAG: DUF4139 domain-containing protein [Marinilabiliales bacterium]|nr:DUF4139 domain-containing protein [Marinilabiliales bacterium]
MIYIPLTPRAVKTARSEEEENNKRILEKEKQQLESQLAGTVDKSKLPTGEIVMTVSGTKAVNAKLMLSYVVMNAGWYPAYDIRVSDISSPATVIYKANVWQQSGVGLEGCENKSFKCVTYDSRGTAAAQSMVHQFLSACATRLLIEVGYGLEAPSKAATMEAKAEDAMFDGG